MERRVAIDRFLTLERRARAQGWRLTRWPDQPGYRLSQDEGSFLGIERPGLPVTSNLSLNMVKKFLDLDSRFATIDKLSKGEPC